jgi:adenylate cyclase class 2
MSNQEIEIKFLDIDPKKIEKKLLSLGAKKVFDEVLEEWIYNKPEWKAFRGRVRVRQGGGKTMLAYKETTNKPSEGNVEIEFAVASKEQAIAFVEKMEIPLLRHQQKRRIHFELDDVAIDIDFWPQIPPFLEIEGDSLPKLEKVAQKLGLSLEDTYDFGDARDIIQGVYHVPLDSLEEYVF